MSPPYPFDTMLVFAFLSAILLSGVVLRARMRLVQQFLFPSCLIGGVLGLVLLHTGVIAIDVSSLEALAYHFFNISFISVGLTPGDDVKTGDKGARKLRGAGWMALVQGMTFPIQAALSGLIVLLLGMTGMELFPTFGFLVPLGFNEGPGQALSIGKVWESVGFAHAATIGLTFAAAGYFCSFFIGVPLVNRGVRGGQATHAPRQLPPGFITGILPRDTVNTSAGRLTLHSGNVETLAFQMALVGVAYGLTYGLVHFLGTLMPADAAAILWGFFFFFGLGVALVIRQGMRALRVAHLIDDGIQRRITGWSVDYLIVATVAAIQLQIVWQYWVPIGLMAAVNGIVTTVLVIGLGRRLAGFPLERTAAIYGTVTGTVSCGLLLLRISDPDFRTPVAFELALMNVMVLPIVGGCTLLVNAPLWWGWSLGLTIAVFTTIFGLSLVAMYLLGYLRMRPKEVPLKE
jgi:ESS family glutamate:Na+ symporter